MPPHARPGRGPKPQKNGRTEQRQQKRKRDQEDLQQLEQRVIDLDPKSDEIKNFSHLPLSVPTANGLEASHFQTLTDVQAHAIPLALKGKDVMGAAKTGSGKTLAFLIPVLEKLYRAQWTEYDGLGALIISPTRELAVQIFQVLRKVGRNHVFSAGLVIGGKSLKEEAERLDRMNILVCTPGRMLQHLDQTAGFDANNLQILVLDEADRIMDMGFQSDVDALVEHLPKSRQTLMFSATQSKKVSDLARLSLKDPEYVSVHEAAASATPTNLQQHYIITPLTEKLDTLYGFIKANLKSKIIVFLSSGKQVRFVYESFRHLQPGIPLLHLHGRQKQIARMEITNRFTAAKQSCLFATDVVARGIDFPAVDWVIQADCPEDVDTYIHRVGRTARYQSNGRAVLFLDPSEEPGMLKKLEQKKIPIQKVNVKEKKKRNIKDQLQSMCFQNPDLKYLGQKAFISYTRSIHLQRDKDVFKFDKLDLDGFAASLGLPGTPQVKFRKGDDIKRIKNAPRAGMSSDSESEEDGEKKSKKKNEVRTKYDKMFERTNQDVLSSHYNKLVLDGDERADDDDGDFLSVKRVLKDDELDDEANNAFKSTAKVIDGLGGEEPFVVDSKRREKALKSKKKMLKFKGNSTKVVFDEDGNAHAIYELKDEDDFMGEGPAEEQRRKFVEDETSRVREADVDDKALAKQKRREKREKRKAAERAERMGIVSDDDDAPMLHNADDGEDPLALMRSLPMGGDRSDSEEDREPPKKRAKKWFEDDSEDEKKSKGKGRVIKVQDEPETLEDLEALATGLLD
ncbi:P-loop containing nucleoside triphosphate hydrolase protein [Fusarium redolens]|uniref:ATP-dependent RNA helicase n=1 Tax=Fusarium redolens TaxID=48865 RepID=A0A9P9GQP2_FUSRE|nr:P-loop containing nucleoside triphosphate hydrolase protein [Fusarium redolens]KAH7243556.1 P-loop containing nucleoside triphosphate hydrolase protein [Fusarium redolens]